MNNKKTRERTIWYRDPAKECFRRNAIKQYTK